MYPQDFLFIFHGFLCVLVYGSSISHTRRGLGAGVTQVVDFDCPEEFGYYPHPTDCTQYYVCVFGGALLESCTGGLMYSHELQTCDWPRNVGCGESGGSDGGTVSTVRVTDPRTRNPQQSGRTSSNPQQGQVQVQPTRSSQRQEFNRAPQPEVIQQQLYAEEDLGPAEEVESDRQQRVYRGQPSTIGQVQRDRDGLRPLKTSVHSQNVIPTGPGTQDKISVVSFGSQRPSAPRPQEQYRLSDPATNVNDFDSVSNNLRTQKTQLRTKRQVFARTGPMRTNPAPPSVFLYSDHQHSAPFHHSIPFRNPVPQSSFSYNTRSENRIHVVHPIYQYYRPQVVAAAAHQQHMVAIGKQPQIEEPQIDEELLKLTKSTIQSEFRPIQFSRPTREQMTHEEDNSRQKTKYIESIINPLVEPQIRNVTKSPAIQSSQKTKQITRKPKPSKHPTHTLFAPGNFVRITTERTTRKNTTITKYDSGDNYKNWRGPTKTITHNVQAKPLPTQKPTTNDHLRTSPRPNYYGFIEKPKDYDVRWSHLDSMTKEKRNATLHPGFVLQHTYVPFVKPQEYEYLEYDEEFEKTKKINGQVETYEEKSRNISKPQTKEEETHKKLYEVQNHSLKEFLNIHLRKANMTFFDFIDEVGFKDAEEIKAVLRTKSQQLEITTERTHTWKKDTETADLRHDLSGRLPVTTERVKVHANQIESPRKKIPEEYYENFKPLPTKSPYLTRRPDETPIYDTETRVEQVQAHQLTSTLPQLSPSPRPVERYNTSQRFQPNQYEQFYAVYDDGVDIYRSNDYSQQYQTPSSTPSSNIAQQYRGQTTYKQTQEEHVQEPVQQQQQQHRNTYTQDLYSPPPVLQDYNDQYNVQIDDQQFQQLGQPTPKSSSRSETTNSSKDALTESSVSVGRVPENVTEKTETSPIIRRSDTNSYFSISSFGPSTVLLPPLRFTENSQKFLDTTFPPPKSEKPLFSSGLPSLGAGRANFEPPKNGGALAKTFNSFDNLLSSFIAAVTKSNSRVTPTPAPVPTTTPPTPIPPKTSPETIVRSEIGRIHHDPIIITENFKIRQPTLRKPEGHSQEDQRPIISTPPSPSSTSIPLNQNDYLAYFVELEPKKAKQEVPSRGFLLTKPDRPETITEPNVVTKDNLGFGKEDQVSFAVSSRNRPFNNYVRLLPNSQTQNVQLGATLDLEPIARSQEKKVLQEPENDTIEKQKLIGPITTVSRQPFQPIGKWVVAKNEQTQTPRFQVSPKPNIFDTYTQKPREEINIKGKVEVEPETIQKERIKEVEPTANRGRGNLLQIHANTLPEFETTVVSSPYKFLLVDLDSTTEQLSTPAPFSRNPENEERNRFPYKTNPESRVKPIYFDNSTVPPEVIRTTLSEESVNVPTEPTSPYSDNDDRIRFSYKTNPENRFRSRYLGSGNIVIDDNKQVEDVEITPKIIVPEEKPVLALEETPSKETDEETTKEPEVVPSKRRKPEFRPKNVEIEPSTRRPYRFRSTTEEIATNSEELRKPPRRIVKIHRNDLKNQRLSPAPKLKRLQKPSTKSPIVVLEDLEEKTLVKENEIHPTYRPIIVTDTLDAAKNKSRFRFTVEDDRDFSPVTDNKIGLLIDTAPRGFERPTPADRSPTSSPAPAPKRPPFLKSAIPTENRATTKASRGKFKPSEGSKLRLRPTTASPDRESTPGPHLSTRQPGSFTIGSSGNEVTVNRGTPAPNRGTRPTLKPSTAIVSKASDFIDIYKYPPRRPQNLYATPTPDKSAAKCRKDVCLLPDCSCGGKDIPGGYSAEEIPQLVLLTFDDSVNDLNKGLYAELFERGRVNPNGCPISATFYVSHEWTDYSQVQNLYANGHEIASHSITHSFGEQFSQKKWTKEIAGQREILAAYGGVRLEDIRGMRAPFLAVGGNKMFKMLYDSNFTYDSSMPIYENRPPSWPYTLDYKLFHDCMIPPCPTKSYPGVWEVPMVMWQDLNGGRCSMGDACSNPPTADGVYKMLIKNFERHFTTNRAPFGLYYHAAWFTHEHHKEGFIAFLDTIVNMPEVWLVTNWQAIEWVRNPQPLSAVNNFPPFQCNVEKAKKCNNPKVCNLWHKSGVRYMRTCQPCPDVYPWTGKTGVKNSRVDNEIIEE